MPLSKTPAHARSWTQKPRACDFSHLFQSKPIAVQWLSVLIVIDCVALICSPCLSPWWTHHWITRNVSMASHGGGQAHTAEEQLPHRSKLLMVPAFACLCARHSIRGNRFVFELQVADNMSVRIDCVYTAIRRQIHGHLLRNEVLPYIAHKKTLFEALQSFARLTAKLKLFNRFYFPSDLLSNQKHGCNCCGKLQRTSFPSKEPY